MSKREVRALQKSQSDLSTPQLRSGRDGAKMSEAVTECTGGEQRVQEHTAITVESQEKRNRKTGNYPTRTWARGSRGSSITGANGASM